MPIVLFKDKYYFLNPMFPCEIKIDIQGREMTFLSAESAFRALQYPAQAGQIAKLTGYDARVLALSQPDPADWYKNQDDAMRLVQTAKFEQNPGLLTKLKMIEKEIIFDNFWNDTYWGRSKNKGLNKLGHLLTDLKRCL